MKQGLRHFYACKGNHSTSKARNHMGFSNSGVLGSPPWPQVGIERKQENIRNGSVEIRENFNKKGMSIENYD